MSAWYGSSRNAGRRTGGGHFTSRRPPSRRPARSGRARRRADRPAARGSSGDGARHRARCRRGPLTSTTSPTFSDRTCASSSGVRSATSRPVRWKPAWSIIGIDRHRRIAIEPLLDRAGLGVEHDAQTAERPAVVGDRDEEARRQPVERADLAADERDAAAESHRADAELVDLAHDRGFELGEPRIRIDVVERAEQLLLRVRRSPTCDRRRCRRRSRRARSPCPARSTPRAGCTCARLRSCDRRGRDAAARSAASTARSCSRSRRP